MHVTMKSMSSIFKNLFNYVLLQLQNCEYKNITVLWPNNDLLLVIPVMSVIS